MIDSKKLYRIAKLPYNNEQTIAENEQYIVDMMKFIALPTMAQCQEIEIQMDIPKEINIQYTKNQYIHMDKNDIFLNTSKEQDPYFICKKQGDI